MDAVKRVKIVIPVIPESQNVVLRMNRYERHRALQEKAALIKWYCKERPDKPFQKAHVSIKYYFPDRCRRCARLGGFRVPTAIGILKVPFGNSPDAITALFMAEAAAGGDTIWRRIGSQKCKW